MIKSRMISKNKNKEMYRRSKTNPPKVIELIFNLPNRRKIFEMRNQTKKLILHCSDKHLHADTDSWQ